MPSAGFSHFYICKIKLIFLLFQSVNALSGLFSFLLILNSKGCQYSVMCQCPQRAFLISTEENNLTSDDIEYMCQCPQRAFLISTVVELSETKLFVVCVNALSGLFSFLLILKTGAYDYDRCQCPQRAFLISTVFNNPHTLHKRCVNALSGLFSFLLLPPHEH